MRPQEDLNPAVQRERRIFPKIKKSPPPAEVPDLGKAAAELPLKFATLVAGIRNGVAATQAAIDLLHEAEILHIAGLVHNKVYPEIVDQLLYAIGRSASNEAHLKKGMGPETDYRP